jgi:hypothetical protein
LRGTYIGQGERSKDLKTRGIRRVLATATALCWVSLAVTGGTAGATSPAVTAGPSVAGVWAATGKVVQSTDPAEPAGMRFQRTWLVLTDPLCAGCLAWERDTANGPAVSVLHQSSVGGWSTAQMLEVACSSGAISEQVSRWALRSADGTITATENEALDGACPATLRVDWTARRAPQGLIPDAIVLDSLKTAEAEPGFVTHSAEEYGGVSMSMVTQSGRNSGLQSITVRDGAQRGKVSIVLTGQNIFVKGNAFGLQYMGFSPTAAAAESGQWVEATGGASEPKMEVGFYQSAAASLTVSSAVEEIGLDGPITLVPALVMRGSKLAVPVRMTAVENKQRLTCTLYLQLADHLLPDEEVTTGGGGGTETDVFGTWGHAPVVVAPGPSVPLNTAWLVRPDSVV